MLTPPDPYRCRDVRSKHLNLAASPFTLLVPVYPPINILCENPGRHERKSFRANHLRLSLCHASDRPTHLRSLLATRRHFRVGSPEGHLAFARFEDYVQRSVRSTQGGTSIPTPGFGSRNKTGARSRARTRPITRPTDTFPEPCPLTLGASRLARFAQLSGKNPRLSPVYGPADPSAPTRRPPPRSTTMVSQAKIDANRRSRSPRDPPREGKSVSEGKSMSEIGVGCRKSVSVLFSIGNRCRFYFPG
jgi:hypothetical protein